MEKVQNSPYNVDTRQNWKSMAIAAVLPENSVICSFVFTVLATGSVCTIVILWQ